MLQYSGLTTTCIQIHTIWLFWESNIEIIIVLITTYLFPSNSSVYANPTVFKFYCSRYLVMISCYVLSSSTISRKFYRLSCLRYSIPGHVLSQTFLILFWGLRIFNCTILFVSANIGIVDIVDCKGIIIIIGWSHLKYN